MKAENEIKPRRGEGARMVCRYLWMGLLDELKRCWI